MWKALLSLGLCLTLMLADADGLSALTTQDESAENRVHFQRVYADETEARITAAINDATITSYVQSTEDITGEPAGSLIWALPGGTDSVSIITNNVTWRSAEQGELPDSVILRILESPRPLIAASPVMRMRGMPLLSAALNPVQPDENGSGIRICETVDFTLVYHISGPDSDPRLESYIFYSLLSRLADNLDEVSPAPPPTPEPYLIITPSTNYLTVLDSLVEWKRSKGHTVHIAALNEIGWTEQAVKSYLQEAYDTWPEPPVYVTLIGDVDGTNAMPSWLVTGSMTPLIISDHPYTTLDGEDYLPDILIGRLSVDTINDLLTVVNKCVGYEIDPFEPEGQWRSRMMIVGVRSTPHDFLTYNSAWPTLEWIGRMFLDEGYTQILEVPYPGSTAQSITNGVNSGLSFIAYRGFGSPSGWSYPDYNVYDMNSLGNGNRMPVVASIVCGGGAFDDSGTDPCFGEKWLRLGTPLNPSGGIGFIGPSERDTKTRWNNTIIAGMFDGVLHEGVNTLSAAMLRGKLELIRQFPNNLDNNQWPYADYSVGFYFNCYNLLGDPGLNFFVGPVRDLSHDAPESIAFGTPTLRLHVTEEGTPLPHVWGTVRYEDEIFSRTIGDDAGNIILELPQEAPGTVEVTLWKPRHEPAVFPVSLIQQSETVAAAQLNILDNGTYGSSGNGDGNANPGERLALNFVVHNFGSSVFTGGTVTVSSADNLLIPADSTETIPTLSPGSDTGLLTLLIDISETLIDGSLGELAWTIQPGDIQWTTSMEIYAPVVSAQRFLTDGAESNPVPNATAWLTIELFNSGRTALENSTVELVSSDPSFTILSSQTTYGPIETGSAALPTGSGFQVTVGDVYPGEWIDAELAITTASIEQHVPCRIPIGNLTGSDPTHPDGYGYRAFQNTDADFAETPEYAWFEIDPTRGGSGMIRPLYDDGPGYDATITTDLPFGFKFYGTVYDEVSICSNGFISFGETEESFFRNYSLPAIASPDNLVCAFWDDLSKPEDGHLCTYTDTESSRFIIQWSRFTNEYGSNPEETFQIILYDTTCWPTRTGDGDILVQYQSISNVDAWDNYATIGLQDRDIGQSLQVSYANQNAPGVSIIRSGQSILFTTGRPVDGPYVEYSGGTIDDDDDGGSSGNNDGLIQNGETIELQVRLTNTGTGTVPESSGLLQSDDSYIAILDPNLSIPTIPSGEEVNSTVSRVVFSPETPNNHSANFRLYLSGGALPCIVLPSVTVYGPVLSLLPTVIDDDSVGESRGNDNGELNPLEIIELTPGASNSGMNTGSNVTAYLRTSSNRVLIMDSTASFGSILPDEEIYALDPFVVRIMSNSSNGDIVNFEIVIRDEFGTEWPQTVNYTIVEANVAASGVRIEDPAPGGNGDGHLLPGESGLLFPRVVNTMLGTATNIEVTLSTEDPLISLQNTTVFIGTVSGNSIREAATPVQIDVSIDSEQPRTVVLDVLITGDGGISVSDVFFLLIGNALLFTDFEDTSGSGWEGYGDNNWHLQTRDYISPSHAFYCGRESSLTYPPLADDYLRSPRFDFSGTGTLVFSTRYRLFNTADVCRVQFQTDYTTYLTLDELTGTEQNWHQRAYSLSDIPPVENARIRFWFTSNASGTAEGWYIDDVALYAEELDASDQTTVELPDHFILEQNYPNPFNSSTTIKYTLPKAAHVRLYLHDVTGRRVATLVDDIRTAGTHRIRWQPLMQASGIYFIRLDAGGGHLTRKMIYLK